MGSNRYAPFSCTETSLAAARATEENDVMARIAANAGSSFRTASDCNERAEAHIENHMNGYRRNVGKSDFVPISLSAPKRRHSVR